VLAVNLRVEFPGPKHALPQLRLNAAALLLLDQLSLVPAAHLLTVRVRHGALAVLLTDLGQKRAPPQLHRNAAGLLRSDQLGHAVRQTAAVKIAAATDAAGLAVLAADSRQIA
jgi:hypothetical protein